MYRLNRLPHLSSLTHRTCGNACTLVIVCGLVMTLGCGGSEPAKSTVVTPPAPSSSTGEPSPSEATEPPGGLEMPEGTVPEDASGDAEPKAGGIEMPEKAVVPAEPGADSGASIQYGTWDEIEQMVKTSGRITVVDLWSLGCEPCLEEFPGLVRLHKSLGATVQCVSVDIDYDGRKTRPPEHYEEEVVSFLKSVGAEFTNFISRTPNDEVYSATKLDSIPAVLIYGADGQLVKAFADSGDTIGFTYDKDVIPLVSKLAG